MQYQSTRVPAPLSPGAIERRLVTAMFADLVGSTALATRLDAEDVWGVVAEAIARIVSIVEAEGGTVKDLAGDGVMALFGAPESHEDDAERAIRAGLRIARAIETFGATVAARWSVDGLSVRVGVETGPVVVGIVGAGSRTEYGAIGDAVNTAARLQAAAEPGTVLVGDATYRLAAARFGWGEATSLQLKGKAEPVVARRAERALPRRPTTLSATGDPGPFVGREAELAVLGEAAAELTAGRGGVVAVTGPAGLGKSRLMAELRETVRPMQVVWLEGAATPADGSDPLGPMAAMVRRWLDADDADDAVLRERLFRRSSELLDDPSAARDGLGLLLALEAQDPSKYRDEPSVEALRETIAASLMEVIAAYARSRPVVLLLEDLHWAHAATIALAGRLAVGLADLPVLMIVTSRPDPGRTAAELVTAIGAGAGSWARTVELSPLSDRAARALIGGLLGPETLPLDVEGRILAIADGNPYFLGELLRSLIAAGALTRDAAGGWRWAHSASLDLPPTVEKVIASRIDALPQRAREVLRAAAVVGRRFPAAVVADVAGEDGELALGAVLDMLAEEELVVPAGDGGYAFAHALVVDVAYAGLLKAQRRILHRRAAAAIERHYRDRLDAWAGTLARHLAAAGEPAKAADWAERSARRAAATAAHEQAAADYDVAARQLALSGRTDPRRWTLVQMELGEARTRSNDLDGAMEAFQAAAEAAGRIDDAGVLARSAIGYEDALWATRRARVPGGGTEVGLLETARAALERASGGTEAAALRSRVEAALGRALVFAGRSTDGLAASARGVASARAAGDDNALAHALLAERIVRPGPESLAARLAASVAAGATAHRIGDRTLELEARRLALIDHLESGDVAAADAAIERLTDLIEDLRQPLFLWYPPMWRTMRALLAGRLVEADLLLEAFEDMGHRWRYRDVEAVATVQAFLIRREQGRLPEIRDRVEAMSAGRGDAWLPMIAVLHAELGAVDSAERAADAALRDGGAHLAAGLNRSLALTLLADASITLGRLDLAAVAHEHLAPWAGLAVVLGSGAACLGAADYWLGRLSAAAGSPMPAERQLETAKAMNARMGAVRALARTEAALAALREGRSGLPAASRAY